MFFIIVVMQVVIEHASHECIQFWSSRKKLMSFFGSNDLINVCELYQITLNFHLCGSWRYTVNRKISDSMGNAKIKCMKIMCTINTNAVRGRLSKNYLT